jgi:hypothetical protein
MRSKWSLGWPHWLVILDAANFVWITWKLKCWMKAPKIRNSPDWLDSCSWKSTWRLKKHIQISTGILEIGELRLDDVEKGSKIWNCLPKIGCNCTIHVWWVKSWKLHLAKVLRFLWLQSGQKRDLKGHWGGFQNISCSLLMKKTKLQAEIQLQDWTYFD